MIGSRKDNLRENLLRVIAATRAITTVMAKKILQERARERMSFKRERGEERVSSAGTRLELPEVVAKRS